MTKTFPSSDLVVLERDRLELAVDDGLGLERRGRGANLRGHFFCRGGREESGEEEGALVAFWRGERK